MRSWYINVIGQWKLSRFVTASTIYRCLASVFSVALYYIPEIAESSDFWPTELYLSSKYTELQPVIPAGCKGDKINAPLEVDWYRCFCVTAETPNAKLLWKQQGLLLKFYIKQIVYHSRNMTRVWGLLAYMNKSYKSFLVSTYLTMIRCFPEQFLKYINTDRDMKNTFKILCRLMLTENSKERISWCWLIRYGLYFRHMFLLNV